ncbi:MAG TPA: gliding motility-associated C-terminal domain-containing protein [Prolixibacteraceae bacterium]
MVRLIFIFPFILVYFLTIVSKNASGCGFIKLDNPGKSETISGKDTILSIFKDDFESGILSGWKQTEDWEVSSMEIISGNFSLKHLSTAKSGSSSIFHGLKLNWNNYDLEWSFKLKNKKWDPSSSNKFWFYLSADTIRTDLINGFAVGVNISGSSDLLSLWRIKKGKADSLVIQSDLDWNASNLVTINVKRTVRGKWTLNYQKSGETISKAFPGSDLTVFDFKNIGLFFKYTPTRAGQLWIDDISVNRLAPELFIQKLVLLNSHQIRLVFSAPINRATVHSENFKLSDENNQMVAITEAIPTDGSANSIDISFGKVEGVDLKLSISGISDLSGKTMNPVSQSFSYSFSPEVGSILINEILFNPFAGGVDFVELVNVSESTIPVHRLMLATRNDTLALKQIYPISAEKRYLKTRQYLTCTNDSAILAAQYFTHNPESFCVMKSVPSFPDDAGTVVLLNDSLQVLDEFSYSSKMHSPFLADENGVSLERISLEQPTSDRSNWASAAASVGFASPGLPNSQTESETEIQDEIIPEPPAFSPNGDGYNDQLTIKFSLNKPGFIANVRIFDAVGRQVKFLVKNQSLAQDGSWLWDGDSDNGQRLNLGVYIILVEIFDQTGNTKTFKKTCTLTDRLN